MSRSRRSKYYDASIALCIDAVKRGFLDTCSVENLVRDMGTEDLPEWLEVDGDNITINTAVLCEPRFKDDMIRIADINGYIGQGHNLPGYIRHIPYRLDKAIEPGHKFYGREQRGKNILHEWVKLSRTEDLDDYYDSDVYWNKHVRKWGRK